MIDLDKLRELLQNNNIEDEVYSAIEDYIAQNYISKDLHQNMLFDSAIKGLVYKNGVKSDKAISGFIDKNKLTFENGEVKGLEEQLGEIRKNHSYLFKEPVSTGESHIMAPISNLNDLSDEEYYNLKFKKE